jgi:hypothetical protein
MGLRNDLVFGQIIRLLNARMLKPRLRLKFAPSRAFPLRTKNWHKPKQLLDRKSPIQVRIPFPPGASRANCDRVPAADRAAESFRCRRRPGRALD